MLKKAIVVLATVIAIFGILAGVLACYDAARGSRPRRIGGPK
jgi:hypothetical protein